MSIPRQARIVLGLMVLAASVAAGFGQPVFAGIVAFLGAGLVFSGLVGFCGTALILSRLPWNRGRRDPKDPFLS